MCTTAHGMSDISFALFKTWNNFDFLITRYNVVNLTKGVQTFGIFTSNNSGREVIDECIVMSCNSLCFTNAVSGGETPVVKRCFLFGNTFQIEPSIAQQDDSMTTRSIRHLREWECKNVPSLMTSPFTREKDDCLNMLLFPTLLIYV